MIVLRSPKGWTGPKVVDGLQIEGTFRAHQVPMLVDPDHLDHVPLLESWMKSYRPEELFDAAAGSSPSWRTSPRRVTDAWGPTPTPTAVCCCTISKCRTFVITRSRSPPRARKACDTEVLGRFCEM
jgi:xylulose-5-phosphate/fructose-6-phosphate phosphoketolase